jgi:hypothetical protein
MNISADTFCFLAVAALFVLFILPRLIGSMAGGYPQGNYPQGNYPNSNGTLNGNDRPTYDSTDVESRGSIGRDRGRSGGGIFGNVLSRPSSRPGSSGGTGIFRTPSSGGNLNSSSSSRHDSPNVESRGSIGRDRD